MTYRPEIDGLRAIAVLAVVFYHTGVVLFSGGFLGVDIFFVISGFLITQIIFSDRVEDFSALAKFYERRLRRIVPALYLIVMASACVAIFFMLPDELENFGQSMVATAVFSNNYLLALTTGYWELAAEYKPLLHTWSLGVEAQFYVTYPLIMFVCIRYCGRFYWIVPVVLSSLSFVFSCWLASIRPDWGFYSFPTRAWEFFAGAFAAFCVQGGGYWDDKYAQGFSFLGLFLIAFSVITHDDQMYVLSAYSILPVIGSVLVLIFARPNTFVNQVLSLRPLVGLGLISYSVYLWHYALFAFARIYAVEPLSSFAFTVLIFISLALGWLTWHYVETPFRRQSAINRRLFLGIGAAAISIILFVGFYFHWTGGVPGRLKSVAGEVAAADTKKYNTDVFRYRKDHFSDDQRRKVLVSGYSYARDVVNMILENYDSSKLEIVYRDDFMPCIRPFRSKVLADLYVRADVIVFSYAKPSDLTEECVERDIATALADKKHIYYTGTKHFGANLNWLVRLETSERILRKNPVPKFAQDDEEGMRRKVPRAHFIPIMENISGDGMVIVTDEQGRLLSDDRTHLSRAGAKFVGRSSFRNTSIETLLR